MAKDWRCLIGRHDWRAVETDNRDKYVECTRCGKHDWTRLVKWSGDGDAKQPCPGRVETVSQQRTLMPLSGRTLMPMSGASLQWAQGRSRSET